MRTLMGMPFHRIALAFRRRDIHKVVISLHREAAMVKTVSAAQANREFSKLMKLAESGELAA